MDLFDIFLIVILFFFTWKGFRTGLIGAIGGFLGILVGIWAGSHYMPEMAGWIMQTINLENASLANIVAFVVIFAAINIVFSIIVTIINRVFHIIPFIDLLNKLMGALVGLLGGILAVSALVYLMSLLPISDTINNAILNSQLAHWANDIAVVIKPFIPEAIRQLKSIFENVS